MHTMTVAELIETLQRLNPAWPAYVMVADVRGAYAPLHDVRVDDGVERATLIGDGKWD